MTDPAKDFRVIADAVADLAKALQRAGVSLKAIDLASAADGAALLNVAEAALAIEIVPGRSDATSIAGITVRWPPAESTSPDEEEARRLLALIDDGLADPAIAQLFNPTFIERVRSCIAQRKELDDRHRRDGAPRSAA